jgi:amino-acid N-acetyltransferase
MHTGKVRKINAPAIHSRLEQGDVILISPLGLLTNRRDF